MATNTLVSGIRVTDESSAKWDFPLMPTDKGGVGLVIEPRAWEPGDPLRRWRIPLHPFIGGLNVDRLNGTPKTYMRGPCDGRYPGLLLFPPKVNSLSMTNASTPVKAVVFDSKVFLIGGRYVYYYNPADDTVTEDEDLGVGVSAVDGVVFNNELIIACGESTKIFKRATSGTYTQATDATYAIALGVVGSYLWRAESTNKLSNCASTPLTLANWTPASPNQYTVGDTTWAVNTIIDYGGIPWIGKGDGFYAPDPQSRFKNQTPNLLRTPHVDNCKGAFIAHAALWAPSSSGLIRIRPGKSPKRGPEVTSVPSYRFWVRGGVEYGDWIYLLCTDEGASGNTRIVAMGASDLNAGHGMEYVYHHLADLDGTTKGYFIAVTTAGTNPRLVAGYGTTGLRWLKLGRGGGRDPDDSGYDFGASMIMETGPMMPAADITMLSTLVGVDVACDFSRSSENESLTVAYRYDSLTDDGGYTDMLSSRETSTSQNIRVTPSTTVAGILDLQYETSAGWITYNNIAMLANVGGTWNSAELNGGTITDVGGGVYDYAPLANGAIIRVEVTVTNTHEVQVVAKAKAGSATLDKFTLANDFGLQNQLRYAVVGAATYDVFEYDEPSDGVGIEGDFYAIPFPTPATDTFYLRSDPADTSLEQYVRTFTPPGGSDELIFEVRRNPWLSSQVNPGHNYLERFHHTKVGTFAESTTIGTWNFGFTDGTSPSGTAAVATSGFTKATRYAAANVQGRYLEIKFTGASDSTQGTTRPVIREAWAFGYSHPEHTDVISLGLWAIDGAEVNGRGTGISRDECIRKWRDWQNRGVELLLELEGYERSRNTRVLVKKVEVLNVLATPGKHPGTTQMGEQVKVQLIRVDRAGAYADA